MGKSHRYANQWSSYVKGKGEASEQSGPDGQASQSGYPLNALGYAARGEAMKSGYPPNALGYAARGEASPSGSGSASPSGSGEASPTPVLQAVAEAEARRAPEPSQAECGPAARFRELAHLPADYAGEDEEARFRGGHVRDASGEVVRRVTTHYMSPEERAASAVRANDAAQLVDAEGRPVDSAGAAPGQQAAAADRLIYAMDAEGSMHVEDAQGWTRRHRTDAHTPYMHHSSFFGGASVAGAGDMEVREGWVRRLSNRSGHYKPGDAQLLNTVDALHEQGVNADTGIVERVDQEGRADGTARIGPYRESRGDFGLLRRREGMLDELGRRAGQSPPAVKAQVQRERAEAAPAPHGAEAARHGEDQDEDADAPEAMFYPPDNSFSYPPDD